MKKFLSTCLYTPRALNDFTACPNAENRKEKSSIVDPMENSESSDGVKFASPLKVHRTHVILVQPQGLEACSDLRRVSVLQNLVGRAVTVPNNVNALGGS